MLGQATYEAIRTSQPSWIYPRNESLLFHWKKSTSVIQHINKLIGKKSDNHMIISIDASKLIQFSFYGETLHSTGGSINHCKLLRKWFGIFCWDGTCTYTMVYQLYSEICIQCKCIFA